MKKYILVTSALLAICIGACAQSKLYTFVFLNNKPDKEVLSKEKSDSIMTGHMNNIGRLAKEGKLIAAGPFEGGGGIFVLNTTSINEATQWLSTDPGVKAKRWNLEVLSYSVRTGSLCAVGEKFEMVFYQFVRFTPEPNVTPEALKQHTDFLQKLANEDSVLHEGTFGDKQGGILVLNADATKETVAADPAVNAGSIRFEMKKLYIAKGSFCEK
jgi:uncharacterized protein YciI